MPAPVSVGPNATYIPSLADSGRLQVEFSRNVNSFALNRYIKTQPVKKQTGFYLRIDEANHSRIVGGNIDEYVWVDGADRPVLNNNGDQFSLEPFKTTRRNFGERLGNLAVEQADWDLSAIQMRTQAQKAMTARTVLVHAGLKASANWDSAHIIDVSTASGLGAWSGALSTNPLIKKTIGRAVRRIMLATNSAVRRQDLVLVINPTTAQIMGETQEVIDFIKQSPAAKSILEGDEGWNEYQIPRQMYGLKIEVEDAVVTTSPRGATSATKSFVMDDALGYILSRPGKLEAKNDGPSYSTVTLMVKEDMSVEKRQDAGNRRSEMNVVDDVGFANTAPIAGVKLEGLYA